LENAVVRLVKFACPAAAIILLAGPGIAAAQSANAIFETNYRSNTLEVYSLTGSDLGVLATPSYPTGLAFDTAGNLFVSSDDPAANAIEKITPDGSISVFATTGLNAPHALVFDSAGNLYVANAAGDTIEKFTPDGVGTEFANEDDGLAGPIDLVMDASGNLYSSNSHGGPTHGGSIIKFTPDGVASVFADSGFHLAYGLAMDKDGNLYVGNYVSSTIEKFSPDGTDLGLFASSGLHLPHGMAFDSEGNLYVINNGNNTIEKFSSTGADLGVFAATGDGPHFLRFGTIIPSDQHFEIEALSRPTASAPYRLKRDSRASEGAYGFLQATMPGDFVTYSIPVAAAGTYDVKVGIQARNDKGIFQLSIAGVNVGSPQDEYSSTISYQVRDLGTVTLGSAGNVAFQFVVTGRNPRSRANTLAFDYIDLVNVP